MSKVWLFTLQKESFGGHPRIVPGCPSTLSCPKIPRTYWDPPGLSLTRSPPCCLEDPKDIPGSSMYVHSPPFCPEDPPSTPTSSPAPSHWLVYILCPQQQLRWLDLLIWFPWWPCMRYYVFSPPRLTSLPQHPFWFCSVHIAVNLCTISSWTCILKE